MASESQPTTTPSSSEPTTTLPQVQRAWVQVHKGKPATALVLKDDWPVPQKLEAGEILVKVQAGALNPVGYKLMGLAPNFILKRPRVAEYDLAAEVIDPNGTNFKKGDQVFGWVPSDRFKDTRGALQQYLALPSTWVVPRPASITPTQASGFALTVLTAYQLVIYAANVEEGQRVFVNGGSTSVGAFAIQLAKIKGAHVTASASGKNEGFVRGLGADEFFDYTQHPSLSAHLTSLSTTTSHKFHHIIETAAVNDPALYFASDAYLYPGGSYVTVGPQPKGLGAHELGKLVKVFVGSRFPHFLSGVRARFRNEFVRHRQEDLEQVARWVEEGRVRPVVDSVFGFEEAQKAYERIMTGRAVGKVVVKVDPSVE